MIIYGDEGFPVAACRMLDAFDTRHEVRHVTDEFRRGTPDTEWLSALAQRREDHVILTRDVAILTRPQERRALQNGGAHCVVLAPQFNRLKRDELLIAIISDWNALIREIERLHRPTVLRWHHRGRKRIEIIRTMNHPKR